MNYLAHYVFNHEIRRLSAEPYFVLGVALPDFWPHFSRSRRIRWRPVRAARPANPVDAQLRAGLLNHAEVDRHFHALPSFLEWQRRLKTGWEDGDGHPLVRDFLAHLAVELALDRNLLRADPRRADRFYAHLARCDLGLVEQRVAALGRVNTHGLEAVLRGFLARRFLHRYRSGPGLVLVVQRVLEIAAVRQPPPARTIDALIARATEIVQPAQIWAELCTAAGTPPPTGIPPRAATSARRPR